MIEADLYDDNGATRIRLRRKLDFVYGEVPAGFVSDGMSVPRWSWGILGPPVDGRTLRACVIHDYLYATGLVSRAAADRLLAELLRQDGYPAWKCSCVWAGTRLFGAKFYRKEMV